MYEHTGPRSATEIKERIDSASGMFPCIEDLVFYLGYDDAREYLSDAVTPERYDEQLRCSYTVDDVVWCIKDYLPFARKKIEGSRGLSTARAIAHFRNWLWLLGDDERATRLRDVRGQAWVLLEALEREFPGKPTGPRPGRPQVCAAVAPAD